MRVYLDIVGIKKSCTVDCITMANRNTEEVLNLSFSETGCGVTEDGITIRLKDEEITTFGLPQSLKGKFGNNQFTYDFIKNSDINSMVIVPFDDNVKLKNLQLKNLCICVGEHNIDYDIKQLKEIRLENEFNEKIG